MFLPRITLTELGRKMKAELEEDKKIEKLSISSKKKQVSNHTPTPYINPSQNPLTSATILMTNDDRFCNDVMESHRKINKLIKLKGKDEKLKFIKQNLMPNLQKVDLPKFFEKKLQDSADLLSSSYYQSKTAGGSKSRNHKNSSMRMRTEEDMFNESLKMVQTFESKLMKIYDKYETFKLQEEKIKSDLQAKITRKINSDTNRQFVDSKKVLQEFYNNHSEEINIMQRVSGEEERRKKRIIKLHMLKYEDFWKKVKFPEKKENNAKNTKEFDFMDYRRVLGKRLSTKAAFQEKIRRELVNI